jgi:H+/Cl- antiporter ClcA
MAKVKSAGRPLSFVIVFAIVLTSGVIANALSAWRTETVWLPNVRRFELFAIERAQEPEWFVILLVGMFAGLLLIYWDIWRTYRRRKAE